MKLLGHNILIEPTAPPKTIHGIAVPDGLGQENAEGIVLAIGSGITESRPYTKGSHVFLEMYKGIHVQIKGKDCLIVKQDDICGVLVNGGFRPIGDKILLRPLTEEKRDNLLIVLPDYSKDRNQYADDALGTFMVHFIGNGIRNKKGEYRPFNVKVGDKVLCKPFIGRDVDTLSGTFKLVKEENIEAILE